MSANKKTKHTKNTKNTKNAKTAAAMIGVLHSEPREDAAELGAAELLEIAQLSAADALRRFRDEDRATYPRLLCANDEGFCEFEFIGSADEDSAVVADLESIPALGLAELFAGFTAVLQQSCAHAAAVVIARPAVPEEDFVDDALADPNGVSYVMAVVAAESNGEVVEVCAQIDPRDPGELGEWWQVDPDTGLAHALLAGMDPATPNVVLSQQPATVLPDFQPLRPADAQDMTAGLHASLHKGAIEREITGLASDGDVMRFITFASDDAYYSAPVDLPGDPLEREHFCTLVAGELYKHGARAAGLSATTVNRVDGNESILVIAADSTGGQEAWMANIIRSHGAPKLTEWVRVGMGGTFMFMLCAGVENMTGMVQIVERDGYPPAFAPFGRG
jgi:hypothetical protein